MDERQALIVAQTCLKAAVELKQLHEFEGQLIEEIMNFCQRLVYEHAAKALASAKEPHHPSPEPSPPAARYVPSSDRHSRERPPAQAKAGRPRRPQLSEPDDPFEAAELRGSALRADPDLDPAPTRRQRIEEDPW